MSSRIEKPDADEIRAVLRELHADPRLAPAQRRWSYSIYHYSDVRNVAQILRGGRIYSRQRLKQLGLGSVEIAQLSIIEQSPWAHPYVRLYFRPATPTQHGIEGIRANPDLGRAHCPVPVFLVFDSESLLTRQGCWFTNTNLARSLEVEMGDRADFMRRRLNFEEIYHDAPLAEGPTKRRIIGARCAEVLFQDELDLQELREIVCRTDAERETLLSLLADSADLWRAYIRVVEPGERMFFRDHAYVQSARLLGSEVLLLIGGHHSAAHTYRATIRLEDERRLQYEGNLAHPRQRLRLPHDQSHVAVMVEISGCLAYRGVLTRGGVLSAAEVGGQG